MNSETNKVEPIMPVIEEEFSNLKIQNLKKIVLVCPIHNESCPNAPFNNVIDLEQHCNICLN